MATSTVENYIKAIYLERRMIKADLLPVGKLAQTLKVVPGTATTMVKSLSAAVLAPENYLNAIFKTWRTAKPELKLPLPEYWIRNPIFCNSQSEMAWCLEIQ